MKFKKPVIKKKPKKAIDKLNEIKAQIAGPGTIAVGLPKDANPYPDGTSVIMVGAVHEFGSASRNIPERSFLRATVVGNRRGYKQLLRRLGKNIATGELKAVKALGLLGEKVKGDVQSKIVDISEPPNKPATIAEKGSSNPLVDTGHLNQSITYEINE